MPKFNFELTDQEFRNLQGMFRQVERETKARIDRNTEDINLVILLTDILALDAALESKILAGVVADEVPAIVQKKDIVLYDGCRVRLADDSIVELVQIRDPNEYLWCFRMNVDYVLHDFSHQVFKINGQGYHDLDVVEVL